jgi:hypothetical protein
VRHRGPVWGITWTGPHLPHNSLLKSRLNAKIVKPSQKKGGEEEATNRKPTHRKEIKQYERHNCNNN